MLVTKSKYARLCKVDPRTIYYRVEKKILKVTIKKLPDGSKEEYIDTKKFPPVRMREKGAGRKRIKN